MERISKGWGEVPPGDTLGIHGQVWFGFGVFSWGAFGILAPAGFGHPTALRHQLLPAN